MRDEIICVTNLSKKQNLNFCGLAFKHIVILLTRDSCKLRFRFINILGILL